MIVKSNFLLFINIYIIKYILYYEKANNKIDRK